MPLSCTDLIINALPSDQKTQLVGIQVFFGINSKPSPEVGQVKYIKVLDEIADCKDTILHIIGELYQEHIIKHGHVF